MDQPRAVSHERADRLLPVRAFARIGRALAAGDEHVDVLLGHLDHARELRGEPAGAGRRLEYDGRLGARVGARMLVQHRRDFVGSGWVQHTVFPLSLTRAMRPVIRLSQSWCLVFSS